MERRKFIAATALLTGGILFSGCAVPKNVITDGYVRGRVKSGKKGIAGVVVSDGYTVMQTNKNGFFEFQIHPDATSVFISTPSGYNFVHENYISRHYITLTEGSNKQDLEFTLTPSTADDTDHTFIIWADPQVKNNDDVEKMMKHSVTDVQKLVASIDKKELVHAITVGDIVWDNLPLYNEYNTAVNKMAIPFFQCIGNHDMDYTNGSDASSDDTFQKTYGPVNYSFNRGKAHYVVLDSVRYLGKGREYDGYILDHYLEWLKKDLSYVPPENLIILCTHIPIHNGVKNNTALYEILEGRNVHIMSGHTHYNENVISNGVYEHNHGTVCGAWWTGAICSDGTPNGYGVYKVKGTALNWHYQSTGRNADHQMKIFLEDYDQSQKQVVVNIWNYDTAWTNKITIDGVDAGELIKYEGFDPGAYKNLLGPELPKKRGFAEPRLTEHMFKKLIPAETKEFTILATDRFGRQYKKSYKV